MRDLGRDGRVNQRELSVVIHRLNRIALAVRQVPPGLASSSTPHAMTVVLLLSIAFARRLSSPPVPGVGGHVQTLTPDPNGLSCVCGPCPPAGQTARYRSFRVPV